MTTIFAGHLGRVFVGLVGLTLLLIMACGDDDTPVPPTSPGVQPTTATQPTAVTEIQTITVVFGGEPPNLDVYQNPGCGSIGPQNFPCEHVASDPLTYIDTATSEIVPLSGVDRWEQIDPDRWRFYLRDGVKFHNGEAWNAAAAESSLDWFGATENGNSVLSYAGFFNGEAVAGEDLQVDVVCTEACPIFPRTGFMIWFQAPEWYSQASDLERAKNTVGFGPYEITSHRPGIDIGLTAYEDYLPNTAWDAQAPTIGEITMVWREEPLVRSAMVRVNEAQWTLGLGIEQLNDVPVFTSGGAGETFVNVIDSIWHPELKKLGVRQAMAHAIDCDTMLEELYQGSYDCWGGWAPEGTLGNTARNTAPYTFDPDLSRDLLAEANYDPANEIVIFVFAGRFFHNTEVAEATANYWGDVGINASVQVLEFAKWLDVALTGCMRAIEEFAPERVDDPNPDCRDLPPGPESFASPQVYQLNPSNEQLDFSRSARSISCDQPNSKVCDPVNIDPKVKLAVIAAGDDRRIKMEELADIFYDQVFSIPILDAREFYGLSDDLEWTPRDDKRLRVNTMRYK